MNNYMDLWTHYEKIAKRRATQTQNNHSHFMQYYTILQKTYYSVPHFGAISFGFNPNITLH